MKLKLGEICDIQPGFSFRGKIEVSPDGGFQVLQIKDIDKDGIISGDGLTRTDYDNIKSNYLVQQNDVLFTTLGENRRAAYVAEKMPDTIFVAQIYSLRNLDDPVSEAYLAWYLNQKPAQNYFESYASGAYIKNIKVKVLESLEIEIIPLEVQHKIVKLNELHRREKILSQTIQIKRSQILERSLLDAVSKNSQ